MQGQGTTTPPWLSEQAEIGALLQRLLLKYHRYKLGKLKESPSETLQARHFPHLFQMDEASDQSWLLLQTLTQPPYELLDITVARKRAIYDAEFLNARIRLRDADLLQSWLPDVQDNSQSLHQWQTAVEQYRHRFPGAVSRLRQRRVSYPGKSDGEIIEAFAQLGGYAGQDLTLRQLSARCFWDSKFLDTRNELLEELYPNLSIRGRPVLVNVALPDEMHGVLLIENLDSFLTAIDGKYCATQGLALVYSGGFMGSAQRIREHAGAQLFFNDQTTNGQRARFSRWWYGGEHIDWPVSFWGDLDFSGMAILKALKQRFIDLRAWQPGYQNLLNAMVHGLAHAPEQADKGNQSDPGNTGCPYADKELLPAMRQRKLFVDQEVAWLT